MDQPEENERKKWLKRGGIGLFLFFLIKGLIWLAVFAAAYFGISWFEGCG